MSPNRVLDPRTPVLIGVGALSARATDADDARPVLDLMADALETAAEATPAVLDRVDLVIVPEGTWQNTDPGRLLVPGARTVLAEVGVLQTTPYATAASRIAAGAAEVVAIVGGEAKHRDRLLAKARAEPDDDRSPGTLPDETWAPAGEILPALEIERDLAVPAQQYALIEQALRLAEGMTTDEHRRRLADRWAAFSQVAATNPHAWNRDPVDPALLESGSAANPWISTPYTRLHCSQWNVDQAAASLMCSVELAERLGVPRDRWVFPLASADSDEMIPLTQRDDPAASPGFAVAGEWVASQTGVPLDELEVRELYSCFPAAVQVQVRELGLDPGRPLTTSGGMSFAGGPLNNFVLQAMEPFV
ncbi:MAG TPA: hypothetical protein VJM33_16230, partial [Microthrixaceae bacterium]|nr:hypothetical protein [Microthrixaceae bacterium]